MTTGGIQGDRGDEITSVLALITSLPVPEKEQKRLTDYNLIYV